MRNKFDEQLKYLNKEMTNMGNLCQQVISKAIKVTMDDGNQQLKHEVLDIDNEIDRKEREIETICMKLLLRQQPVATDLRIISSALKMISDMERIGDQASDIVELAKYVKNNDIKHNIHLDEMAQEVIKMVDESVDSFVNKDLYLARTVIISDDIVDNYFDDIKRRLIKMITETQNDGEEYIDLLMIAKYLERIGDHATNIAEWVEFSITGVHKDGQLVER